MMEHGQLADALALLTNYGAAKPNSLDAWNLLRQIHTRQNNTKDLSRSDRQDLRAAPEGARRRSGVSGLCRVHRLPAAAKCPPPTWLELCKGAEEMQDFDRALAEYRTWRSLIRPNGRR